MNASAEQAREALRALRARTAGEIVTDLRSVACVVARELNGRVGTARTQPLS
jgi:hypothetical protein